MSGAVHGTAIVVGTTGLLIVGPSGAGKSRLALAFLAEAHSRRMFAALVADDRVFLEAHGDRIVAQRPDSIRDLIEIRGTGIGTFPSVDKAVIGWAIMAVAPGEGERLPIDNEVHETEQGLFLPLLRISADSSWPLTVFEAMLAERQSVQAKNAEILTCT